MICSPVPPCPRGRSCSGSTGGRICKKRDQARKNKLHHPRERFTREPSAAASALLSHEKKEKSATMAWYRSRRGECTGERSDVQEFWASTARPRSLQVLTYSLLVACAAAQDSEAGSGNLLPPDFPPPPPHPPYPPYAPSPPATPPLPPRTPGRVCTQCMNARSPCTESFLPWCVPTCTPSISASTPPAGPSHSQICSTHPCRSPDYIVISQPAGRAHV